MAQRASAQQADERSIILLYNEDERQQYKLHRVQGKSRRAAYHAVQAWRRRNWARRLVSYCRTCGFTSQPFRSDGQLICRQCWSTDIKVAARFVTTRIVEPEVRRRSDMLADDARLWARLRAALPKLPRREAQVVSAIAGFERGPCHVCPRSCKGQLPTGGCDNYIRRIADWLRIGQTAVNIYRRQAVKKLKQEDRRWRDRERKRRHQKP